MATLNGYLQTGLQQGPWAGLRSGLGQHSYCWAARANATDGNVHGFIPKNGWTLNGSPAFADLGSLADTTLDEVVALASYDDKSPFAGANAGTHVAGTTDRLGEAADSTALDPGTSSFMLAMVGYLPSNDGAALRALCVKQNAAVGYWAYLYHAAVGQDLLRFATFDGTTNTNHDIPANTVPVDQWVAVVIAKDADVNKSVIAIKGAQSGQMVTSELATTADDLSNAGFFLAGGSATAWQELVHVDYFEGDTGYADKYKQVCSSYI